MEGNLELTTRQALAREAAALQATLDARAEAIGAPPPLLEQDVDGLVLAGGEDYLRPDPASDPAGYRDWLISWAGAARTAVELSKSARAQVAEGRYDEDLRLALNADGLIKLLKAEEHRLERESTPELGL